ncbi:MAG TPA: hypothetical protein VMR33_17885 [Candidatus Baltobacteraceae bacterium]|jgi:hypothetical protein|nr:hypothetical protein [Candidatus Baltobacteraceae bacterium]
MKQLFKDRISTHLFFWGVLLLMIAAVLPTKDHFAASIGGRERIITRQDNPLTYWGVDTGLAITAVSLWAFVFYRTRRK